MVPIVTLPVTSESLVSAPIRRATTLMALWKQAEYPRAKSCSGLVPPPAPPISTGGRMSRSKMPSEDRPCPSRPPFTLASAV